MRLRRFLLSVVLLAFGLRAQTVFLGPGSPELRVAGLGWFGEDAPVLRRLPTRMKGSLPTAVWGLAQHPSGGRFRFRTDSTKLTLVATNSDTSTMHHMTTVGQSGFDLYVDGRYRDSAWPDREGLIRREWNLGRERRMREVLVYLPLYKDVALGRIALDDGAKVEAPSPFALPKPVVFYGSSITQGGCAENPGLSYPAIVCRDLDLDFVNLGFSGAGLGEQAVADALAELDPAAYVLDFWANPSPELFEEALPRVADTLRRRHPAVPILVVGPFWFPAEDGSPEAHEVNERKRATARGLVEARRKAGDRRIRFVDGREMISRDQVSGLVDGVHPNSLGFQHCADGLEPHLRGVLRLSKPGRTRSR